MTEDNPLPPILEPEILPKPEAQTDRGWAGITSLVLGIVNLFAWCLPICGGPLAIVGIILGVLGLKSRNRGSSIAGIILSVIGLILSIIWTIAFFALLSSGWFENMNYNQWWY